MPHIGTSIPKASIKTTTPRKMLRTGKTDSGFIPRNVSLSEAKRAPDALLVHPTIAARPDRRATSENGAAGRTSSEKDAMAEDMGGRVYPICPPISDKSQNGKTRSTVRESIVTHAKAVMA